MISSALEITGYRCAGSGSNGIRDIGTNDPTLRFKSRRSAMEHANVPPCHARSGSCLVISGILVCVNIFSWYVMQRARVS